MAFAICCAVLLYDRVALKQNEAFQFLAQQYQGALLTHTRYGRRPCVHFRHANTEVTVDVILTGGGAAAEYTRMKIPWHDMELRLEVYPESFLKRLSNLRDMEDVEIGSLAFDRDYVITGNNLHDLRAFLSLTVQGHINSLRSLPSSDDVYVAVLGGTLLVKKRGVIRDAQQMVKFVQSGLAIFDEGQKAVSEGIEFTHEEVMFSAETSCQICGDHLEQAVVLCKACGTPHHKDCWLYYGACSTYGCGQTSFKRSRGAR